LPEITGSFWDIVGQTVTSTILPEEPISLVRSSAGDSRQPTIASLMFFKASPTSSRWDWHPGSAGQLTT